MLSDRLIASRLRDALESALEHLEFCGWGDSYERSCAYDDGLPRMITTALKAYKDHYESDEEDV